MKQVFVAFFAVALLAACTKEYIQELPVKDGWKPDGQSNYVGRGSGGDQRGTTYISPGTNDDNKPRAAAMPADATNGQQSQYIGPGSGGDQAAWPKNK
jgi:hypothetical protein